MQPIYVSKTLTAASSGGLGSISTAAVPVVTVNTSNMDTARRVIFTSTGDASTMTLTFVGKNEYGSTITEIVKGSTAAGINATTTSDFISLTSVSASSAANIAFLIGTSSVGGTAWKAANVHVTPQILSAALNFTSSANSMTASIDITLDDITGAYQNPNFLVPNVFNSTSHVVAASTNSIGVINNDGQVVIPVSAWRLTITSSSSQAGTVFATVIQAGIS